MSARPGVPTNRSLPYRLPPSPWTWLACLLSFALLAHGSEAPEIPLAIPRALLVRSDQPENDLNLRAYSRIFDAVALGWQIVPASELEAYLSRQSASHPPILVVPARSARSLNSTQLERVLHLVSDGAILVTEEITPLSERLGLRAGTATRVRRLREAAYAAVKITWEHPTRVVSLRPPRSAAVLTREGRTGAPLAALLPYGRGHCLLLAAGLDPVQGEGYARFPYFIHALLRAGLALPFRSERLSALFDYGYRFAANPEDLAAGWRQAGIRALHASAWDFWEPDSIRDEYLRRLIAACHRQGILVNAWLEFPYVSEEFWKKHPQWRDKDAAGRDAHVTFRLLMNLQDPQCFQAVAEGLRELFRRFDWDGADLSELYLEDTPFNAQARAEFKARTQIDPRDFFRKDSRHYWKKDRENWAKFIDYRVEQVRLLTERFLDLLSEIRAARPYLGLTLTYMDNVSDPWMREKVGADIRQVLPLLDRYDFTLIMEDPSTVWHLAARRYDELARSYARLTSKTDRIGIDVNVVDMRKELGRNAWLTPVYPTDKQTGGGFLELFHHAGRNFRTVLAYSESTIWKQDLDLVSYALASGVSGEASGDGAVIKAAQAVVFRTAAATADFRVDGKSWPCVAAGDVLLPAGEHRVTAARRTGAPRPRLVRLNGELLDASYAGDNGIEFSYRTYAQARAIALFDRRPKMVEVDGAPLAEASADFVLLPPGSHLVRAGF